MLSACSGSGNLAPFERTLAANDSATAALGQWCDTMQIADPPRIRAIADRAARTPASETVRKALAAQSGEPIGYRHVQLACGATVLSVAHNWYLPSRLTPDMNRRLESSDTPFGTVVAPLGFRRERLATVRGTIPACPARTILAHRAVLRLRDGQAFSYVIECYTRANLPSSRR